MAGTHHPFSIALGMRKAAISLFGVFDGHGGKAAAAFASKNTPECIRRHVVKLCSGQGDSQAPPVGLQDVPADDLVAVPESDVAEMRMQDRIMAKLPLAMHDAFDQVDRDFKRQARTRITRVSTILCRR